MTVEGQSPANIRKRDPNFAANTPQSRSNKVSIETDMYKQPGGSNIESTQSAGKTGSKAFNTPQGKTNKEPIEKNMYKQPSGSKTQSTQSAGKTGSRAMTSNTLTKGGNQATSHTQLPVIQERENEQRKKSVRIIDTTEDNEMASDINPTPNKSGTGLNRYAATKTPTKGIIKKPIN